MKKFKFIGDNDEAFDSSFRFGSIYNGDFSIKYWGDVQGLHEKYPEDWQEVTEPESKMRNEDMPATSMTKFEMAVINIVSGMCANPNCNNHRPDYTTGLAIKQAKETFKQLEEYLNK
jgi:hypothetical protein